MEEKLVSVIVSFYNEEKYLSACIESILGSTYKNLELILVNDASSDKSEEIVKSCDDPRIVYIPCEKNMGQGHGRNMGMDAAHGDYIAFLDGDDIYDKDKIKNQVDFLNDNPDIVLVVGTFSQIDSNGDLLRQKTELPQQTDEQIRAYMLFGDCIACGGVMFRRSVIDEHHVRMDESLRSSQDYKFFIECLGCGKTAGQNEVVYYYRRGDAGYISHTQQFVKKNRPTYVKNMEDLFAWSWRWRGFDLTREETNYICHHFFLRELIGIKDQKLYRAIQKKISLQSKDMPEHKWIMAYYREFGRKRNPAVRFVKKVRWFISKQTKR